MNNDQPEQPNELQQAQAALYQAQLGRRAASVRINQLEEQINGVQAENLELLDRLNFLQRRLAALEAELEAVNQKDVDPEDEIDG